MKLSHSKLYTILNDPISYYLNYKQGISLKEKKPALAIGSAVHWGIEHNTEDLEKFYKEEGTFKQRDNYTKNEILAESMVHGYLKHKDELFEQVLKDLETGEQLKLLEELHELTLTSKVKSYKFNEDHNFLGIIDLLLKTDKGFIVIDYKTSSDEPDWNKYLDQIYRYIMLLKYNYPDIPVYKIGIINIRKTKIRQKKAENDIEFTNRMKFEYDCNDENYINYHEYSVDSLDKKLIDNYIKNLSKMCDVAQTLDNDNLLYVNYDAQNTMYGHSDYYDIVYQIPDSHVLYKIKDTIWNKDTNKFEDTRDCVPLDMKVIEHNNCLNHYSDFEKEIYKLMKEDIDVESEEDIFIILRKKYLTDSDLLNKYWLTFEKKFS